MTRFDVGCLLIVAQLLCSTACGGNSLTNSGAPGAGGAAGTNAAGYAGIAGATAEMNAAGHVGIAGATGRACPSDLPDARQLAATPRANTNLELLALRFSPGIVADQQIYDRLVRDVVLISTQDQSVSDIGYFPADDGKGLLLLTDAPTLSKMQAGTYSEWDCLNDSYGLVDLSFNTDLISYASLTLKGIYDLQRLSKDYAALPGIQSAEPNASGGDGPTICVVREDSVWHYVFDRAGGDCPAGCTEHEYTHFTVSTAGTVVSLGGLSPSDASTYASREVCRR